MNRNEFLQLLTERVLLMDGAYGTEFFKRGYQGVPGVALNLRAPEAVEQLQRDYVQAGANILLANTFSANRLKLQELGLAGEFEQINTAAVRIARQAGGERTLVFGDISSTGHFPRPIGEVDFTDILQVYTEQAKILADLGVDGYLVETFSDIKELKAAVLGIRSVTRGLPIIASMTFDASLRCVTGTSVAIFATMFEDLDVDVLGVNCTLGPEMMVPVVRELARFTKKPLFVKPNAGEPVYDGKNLRYTMGPEHFSIYMEDHIDLGANIIGGCCGTSPEHIRLMSRMVQRRRPVKRETAIPEALTSRTIYRAVEPFAIIGERINPASRKHFQEEIVAHNYQTLLHEATSQENEGATLIDLNLGIEKMLTPTHLTEILLELDRYSSPPVAMDIQTDEFLEIALREYPGRPLINSARVTEQSLQNRLALLQKYGGMLILLAMGQEIPETAEERFQKVMEGIAFMEANGISRNRIFADPLVLPFGAAKNPRVALDTVRMLTAAGIKTTLGLSNLSYGLSRRSELNGAFLAQAVGLGLTSAIMNPADDFVRGSLRGALRLRGEERSENKEAVSDNPLTVALLAGDTVAVQTLVEKALESLSPVAVSQTVLGKSMEEIGILYGEGKIYLPHLLLASERSQPIFDYVNNLTGAHRAYRGKVLLATVEGDIHDIGKKIIGTVLRSGGYEVVDLGKDISAGKIVEATRQEAPDILGLSAMMTTTVGRVEEVAALVKEAHLPVKLIAGGASMNRTLAAKFGCDGYASNASEVMELCKRMMEEQA